MSPERRHQALNMSHELHGASMYEDLEALQEAKIEADRRRNVSIRRQTGN